MQGLIEEEKKTHINVYKSLMQDHDIFLEAKRLRLVSDIDSKYRILEFFMNFRGYYRYVRWKKRFGVALVASTYTCQCFGTIMASSDVANCGQLACAILCI